LRYAEGGARAHLIAIVDHASKLVLGWAVGERAITEVALKAWQMARRTLKRLGWPLERMIVHHDQDPVFTGYGWTSRLLLDDGVRLSYTLDGARDNTEMEAFFSRFKCENRSLLWEARDFKELVETVSERMEYYNRCRRHSRLGYLSPHEYLQTAAT